MEKNCKKHIDKIKKIRKDFESNSIKDLMPLEKIKEFNRMNRIDESGLYFLYEKDNEDYSLVYIGVSNNIYRRLNQHIPRNENRLSNLAYNIARLRYKKSFFINDDRLIFNQFTFSRVSKKHIKEGCDVERTIRYINNLYFKTYQIDDPKEYRLYESILIFLWEPEFNTN